MSKIGVRVSIDVKAIEKARLINHENGKCYLNMTVFIDPNNPGQYGDHGMITQDITKEEKDGGTKAPILGNVKVFWKGGFNFKVCLINNNELNKLMLRI